MWMRGVERQSGCYPNHLKVLLCTIFMTTLILKAQLLQQYDLDVHFGYIFKPIHHEAYGTHLDFYTSGLNIGMLSACQSHSSH